jgi:hypothetical protein
MTTPILRAMSIADEIANVGDLLFSNAPREVILRAVRTASLIAYINEIERSLEGIVDLAGADSLSGTDEKKRALINARIELAHASLKCFGDMAHRLASQESPA